MFDVEGYKNQKFLLEKSLENRKFSHAYLFSGSDARKKEFALGFARGVLGASQSFNPDLILVEQDKLKIEDIRTLISNLSLKPFAGEYKVAIIENFDSITMEGANSILKTLEEPNPSTIIILLAENAQTILPTILSRVQTLIFDQKEIGVDSSTEEQQEIKNLEILKSKKPALRLLKVKTYSNLENVELNKIFSLWLDAERSKMQQGLVSHKNPQLLADAINGLSRNFNKKAVLERLFLNLV